MTEPQATDRALDLQEAALLEVLPQIRSISRLGMLQAAGVLSVGLPASGYAFSFGNAEASKWGFMLLVLAGGAIYFISRLVRRKQEVALMPLIAQTFGLTHRKPGNAAFDSIPKNLIPFGSKRSADDQMSGELAGRKYTFTEVRTETGGKNSSTIFKGIVLHLTASDLPAFQIVADKETKGFWIFKGRIDVSAMTKAEDVYSSEGVAYGIYLPAGSPHSLRKIKNFAQAVVDVAPRVLGQAKLYSVLSSGPSLYMAIGHKGDLFQIGGIFAGEAKIMKDIRAAASELAHPVTLAGAVLRAEAALKAAD